MQPTEAEAIARFLDDDFVGAWRLLVSLARSGPLSGEARATLELLLDHPLPGWDATDDLDLIGALLAHNDDAMEPLERTRWLARRFDDILLSGGDVQEAALDLIATATLAGEPGWAYVTAPDRYARIQTAFLTPEAQLDLLEQEAFAPEATGIPQAVPGRVFAVGQDLLHTGDLGAARQAERLLHALGQPEFGYALEADRKRAVARASQPAGAAARESDSPALTPEREDGVAPGAVVVLAGGHPPLRRMAERELNRVGVEVREIPSAWEANRTIRAIRDMLAGADVGVLVWRQIAHSTTDQVITAAQHAGVPVVRAATPTVSAIRRAVASVLGEQRAS